MDRNRTLDMDKRIYKYLYYMIYIYIDFKDMNRFWYKSRAISLGAT